MNLEPLGGSEVEVDLGICECCNAEPAVGVACVPGVPMSIAWGVKCLQAGVSPLWLVRSNVALIGGTHKIADWYVDEVEATVAYFGLTMDEFEAQVEEEMQTLEKDLREMEEADADSPTPWPEDHIGYTTDSLM